MGHIQKRMGKRLMDKVTASKNISYTDGGKKYKGIGGIGRLTQRQIQRIQGHYGAAIRENHKSVSEMKKAIWRIWKHYSNDHIDCKNWCPVKSGKGQSKNILPKFVCTIIKPVFVVLSDDELLRKCLHGGSQNTNESYHNLIFLASWVLILSLYFVLIMPLSLTLPKLKSNKVLVRFIALINSLIHQQQKQWRNDHNIESVTSFVIGQCSTPINQLLLKPLYC